MGKFDFTMPEELNEWLRSIGKRAQEIAPKMIEAATPIVEKALRAECEKYSKTGDMAKSIKATKAKESRFGGFYAVVRPTGKSFFVLNKAGIKIPRKKPVRNMDKLAYLEYGTSNGEAPRPVLTKVLKDTESSVTKIMVNVFDKEMSE